ncbi:spore coat protein U-like protein [Novosphingobium sp. PhB165]|uniref:Csu type fimbrial protein n=1 Tax=Novosphingobium sp. PhB165 TaxID=2485105 RepID=UPI0010478CF6|nr:spore coat U domain-containing protein [Novosphingobium sp. PhB165]TCM19651.1 spore coat protein U-like protein [Novosphingobium sp. PhB165]
MTLRYLPVAVALCALILPPEPAQALCLCSCTVSTTAMAFGNYDQTAPTPQDVNATVTINCTSVASILSTADIALSAGASGNATARRMAAGTNLLYYNIFANSAHTTVWGDGTAGTSTVQVQLNGLLAFSSSATAYGRIPALQNVSVGSYADTLTITVTY